MDRYLILEKYNVKCQRPNFFIHRNTVIESLVIKSFIHDDISLVRFVIPGLTKPAPYLIWGNPVFSWIPAFAGMTYSVVINDAVYSDPMTE